MHRSYFLAAVLLTALFVAVACGGGGDETVDPGADSVTPGLDVPTTPDTSAPPDEDVVVGEDTPEGIDIPAGCSDGDPCDDGDPCTTGDRCVDGACSGEAVSCDDGDPCTRDSCDPATGECTTRPDEGADCDDDDPCTSNDHCEAGVCGGDMQACDDGNPCTDDSCDPGTGACAFEPTPGAACDDGNRCTFNGTCNLQGECVGEHIDCDDGVPCTNDVCTPAGQCVHVPAKDNCDDGVACTADFCDPEADCVHGGVLSAEPVQDGNIAEWSADAILARNTTATDVAGADLRALSVSVSRTGLHVGIQGTAPPGQAWLVFLDLNYAEVPGGEGVLDLTTITGASPVPAAAAANVVVDASPGFGADFLLGGVDDEDGCYDLDPDGTATEVGCDIDVDAGSKSIEARIEWQGLFGRAPLEGETWIVAGFAVLVDATTGAPSNQVLPGQSLPVEELFFFPVSGGPCLDPFCGDLVTDPGEACDDGNDDPNDDCDACVQPAPPGMVTVPGGEFYMGYDSERLDDPFRPRHAVWVDTFFIDKYEVTTAEFAEFLNANDYRVSANEVVDGDGNILFDCGGQLSLIACRASTLDDYNPEPGFEDHPIGETSWWGGYRYCLWRGKRLATEAEWEKAARGTDERLYPWGNDVDPDNVNCQESSPFCDDGWLTTAPIGLFPRGVSPYGAHDMSGNVWEWVNDWFDYHYYETSPYENPLGPCNGGFVCPAFEHKVARGGSWDDPFSSSPSDIDRLSTVYRYETSPECNSDIGIRCAMDGPVE